MLLVADFGSFISSAASGFTHFKTEHPTWTKVATIVGLVGSLMIVGAYLAGLEKLDSRRRGLLVINLTGACLILVSLVFDFNLAATSIELFWVAISVYGLFKWSGEGRAMADTDRDETGPISPVATSPFEEGLASAVDLKDFAVRRGLAVPDAILKELSDIKAKAGAKEMKNLDSRLDAVLRDLTNITWPTTTRTLDFAAGKVKARFFQKHFRLILFVLLGASLMLAIVGLVLAEAGSSQNALIGKHLLALSLGLLGSTTYIFFSLMNVVSERAVDESDVFSSYARLMLGPAFGWLSFQIVSAMAASDAANSKLLLVPFVAGFSTRLVLGIINQSIQAIEITMGLNDKRTELKTRGTRK